MDRYAATLYSYNPSLKNVPVAIASNAQQKQIGFDGFEDYEYLDYATTDVVPSHFSFNLSGALSRKLIASIGHTGVKSLILPATEFIELNKVVRNNIGQQTQAPYYNLKFTDCEYQFNPNPGKYIVSAWVKQNVGIPGTSISEAQITVKQKDGMGVNVVADISLLPS